MVKWTAGTADINKSVGLQKWVTARRGRGRGLEGGIQGLEGRQRLYRTRGGGGGWGALKLELSIKEEPCRSV